ncbi:DUF2953 domain-containing protein [Methanimicrococcus sp. OttesenSCG-928-J09]|nr:DUF2953 domain-containing protein [Methanimicrococcus sp. OttesenSCG-928-J09]
MTVQTALLTIGHYLLLAVGLIFLLLIILLAAALIFTLFMRLYADISIRFNNGFRKKINVRLKMPFYEYVLFDSDDFEDDDFEDEDEEDDGNEAEDESENDSELPEDSGENKNIYHVIVTDEKISVLTTESKKFSSDYEIIVHTDVVSETETLIIEDETAETVETSVIEYEVEIESNSFEEISEEAGIGADEEGDVDEDYDEIGEEDDENDEEIDEESDSDFFDDLGDLSDLSGAYDEIKRYVDLSDPQQFVSDSIGAALRISKVSARFAGDLMLQTDIDEMEADVIYGLSDPANTAISFGAAHSFKAAVYAYLVDVEEKTRSSKKRKKAGELGAIVRDDIRIIPDLTSETFEADADMVFSFRISKIYVPTLRFLLNKNTRWVLRRYVYKYFVKQYIKTWKEERRQKKETKKAQRKSK